MWIEPQACCALCKDSFCFFCFFLPFSTGPDNYIVQDIPTGEHPPGMELDSWPWLICPTRPAGYLLSRFCSGGLLTRPFVVVVVLRCVFFQGLGLRLVDDAVI